MKLIWTPVASLELLELVTYVYSLNRSSAVRWHLRTRQKLRQLEKFPYSGKPGRVSGTRELVIGQTPYVAVYVVEADAVIIHHVVHTSQQWPPEE